VGVLEPQQPSRPYIGSFTEPPLQWELYSRVVQLPAAPAVDICTGGWHQAPLLFNYRERAITTFFHLETYSSTRKKVERPWTPSKNCSTRGRDFELRSFDGEALEGKKMLLQLFI
jgi:hypothetical protein